MEGIHRLDEQSAQLKPTIAHPSNPSHTVDAARVHIPFPQRIRVRAVVHSLLYRYRRTQNIWASAFRSFRGHIRLQYDKGPDVGDLGPLVHIETDGSLAENKETATRIRYTEKLLSVCPWADMADREIFLMGFDAAQELYGPPGIRSDRRRVCRMT